MNNREIILEILLELEEHDGFSNQILSQVLDKYDYLEGNEKAFIKRVTQGTVERKIQIDYILNLFSSVPVHKMKKVIRGILRSGVYQILFMDQIPDAAVCNESVKLAAKKKFVSLKGFVNGILRKTAREKHAIPYPDKEKNYKEYLQVVYSMPAWLTDHFIKCYGEKRTEETFQAFLEMRPVTLRIKKSLPLELRELLFKKWEEAGVTVTGFPGLSDIRLVAGAEGIANLFGFAEGYFVVQDVSSVLVGEIASVKPGMKVIDVCSAPGGKAMHAAECLQGTGHLYAYDVSDHKVALLRENLERLGYDNVTTDVNDARCFIKELEEQADVVIADVPCSGLGVIGKKQDIKYHASEKGLQEIVLLQREIISTVHRYVKKGGILLYSTCTMNPEENEHMVEWICKEFGFSRLDPTDLLPEAFRSDVCDHMLQIFPADHKTDGFFIAKLLRQ